jgi:hypothetical protein
VCIICARFTEFSISASVNISCVDALVFAVQVMSPRLPRRFVLRRLCNDSPRAGGALPPRVDTLQCMAMFSAARAPTFCCTDAAERLAFARGLAART